MNKKDVPLWEFGGFVFTALAGTLLHFVYDWSGESVWAAPFTAVDESIFQHIKLLYFPMLLFALVQYRFFKNGYKEFWCHKLKGFLLGTALIPALYYTYTGALGVQADWVNITIFFVAAAAAFGVETKAFQSKKRCILSPAFCFGLVLVMGFLLIAGTFFPPKLPFFQDPVTGKYGI